MAKVVLAYTGGLATSLCIHWLKLKKGLEVITFTANVGQRANLEPIGERAIELGAAAAHIGDLRERFVKEFAFAALRAGAVYESGYYLGTALTRPLITEEMVKIAREDGAEFLAHGCSGRGNDRIRFEAAAAALAPGLEVLAPLEEWGLTSREEQARHARRYGMELPVVEGESFERVDQCLWGIARPVDARRLDPWKPAPEDMFRMTVAPEHGPDEPEDIRIGFRRGTPTRLNGRNLKPVDLLEAVNALGAKHGIGRRDVMEDRISGIKTREIYEAPGAAILYESHKALEALVLPKELLHFKGSLSKKYAELVYGGQWFHPLRRALNGFFDEVRDAVTGDVKVRLFKGKATPRGVRSPCSLYDVGRARLACATAAAEVEAAAGDLTGVRDAAAYALKHEVGPQKTQPAFRRANPGPTGP